MRHTLMLNFDDRDVKLLDYLSRHFRLSAEETARFAIRLTHKRFRLNADVLVPEFKPRAKPCPKIHPEDREPS